MDVMREDPVTWRKYQVEAVSEWMADMRRIQEELGKCQRDYAELRSFFCEQSRITDDLLGQISLRIKNLEKKCASKSKKRGK